MKTTRVTIQNPRGLHARPASEFVRLVQKCRSKIRIRKGNLIVNGKSILGLLMLGASLNTALLVEVDGDDEDETVCAVESFFRNAPPGSHG